MGRMSRWEVELNMALTAKQKKLPKALQQAILKKQKSKGMKKKKKGYAMGGLKYPSADQKGLKKLPENVRNKMGYLSKGGMMKKGYAKGGMQMKKKGYARGGFLAPPARPMKGL